MCVETPDEGTSLTVKESKKYTGFVMSQTNDEEGEPVEKDKSERKRLREKQRRQELSDAFVELADLLARLNPEGKEKKSDKEKKRKRGDDIDDVDNTGTTRIDLIGQTIETLRALQAENAELKRALERKDSQSTHARGDDEREVLVMVPTLSAKNDEHYSANHNVQHPSQQYPTPPYYGYHQQPPPPPPPPPPQQSYHRPQSHEQQQQGGYYGHSGPYWGNYQQYPYPSSQYPPPPQHPYPPPGPPPPDYSAQSQNLSNPPPDTEHTESDG